MTTQETGADVDIAHIPLFASLGPEEHRRIAEVAVYRTCEAGSVIVDVGEPSSEMYVIISGQVKVLPSADWTGAPLAQLGPGEFFGEVGLVGDSAPRTASVVAGVESIFATFSKAEFSRLMEQNPAMAEKVNSIVAARTDGADGASHLSGAHTRRTLPLGDASVSLGRGLENDITLRDLSVSPHHADITSRDGKITIKDANSAGGTYKNGIPIRETDIEDGDEIWLGSTKLFIVGDAIKWFDAQSGMRVEAIGLGRTVGSGREILRDVDLVLSPGELVAIVGPSGSGKTTLLNAILGLEPATRGSVYFDGEPLEGQSAIFRTSLGYVPQDDIVHPELSVEESLMFAAKLRTPLETTPEEMQERVDQVIDELGLAPERDNLVRKLSGGQRKRVSIGVELIGDPRVFFLDEPTSGLDPKTDLQLMDLLRELANNGRTVMLTTHATQNIDICDRIVVLSGGRLAYTGSPREALQYFDTNRFVEVYNRLAAKTPEAAGDEFKLSDSYVRNVHARIVTGTGETLDEEQAPVETADAVKTAKRGFFNQFLPLTDRTFRTVRRDRVNMVLRVLGPPLLGLAAVATFDPAIFELKREDGGNYISVITLLYLAAAISLFLGAFTAGNSITSERAIFRRERLSGLSPVAYVLAKFSILGTFSVLQAVLLIGTISLSVNMPDLKATFLLMGAIALTSLAGTAMGMLVSALSPNADRASMLIVLLLIPQLIFAGSTVPRSEMRAPSKIISEATVSKWSLELTGIITDLESREFKQAFIDFTNDRTGDLNTVGLPRDKRPFDRAFIDREWVRWTVLAGFSVVLLGATLVTMTMKGQPSPFRRRRSSA